ncbi:MAG: lipopolysaccharide ABC transporter ATP-binding protein, partial [Ghiorsea sp.]|nr:lipopolysaccharide ABC transporter ATP-binding protein [Ghiorsea sp.]
TKPKFVLLDEPFAGVDPIAVEDIQGIIRDLRDKGYGILITDHNVRETLSICDRAYLMTAGEILVQGSAEEIVNNEDARRLYFGESFSL